MFPLKILIFQSYVGLLEGMYRWRENCTPPEIDLGIPSLPCLLTSRWWTIVVNHDDITHYVLTSLLQTMMNQYQPMGASIIVTRRVAVWLYPKRIPRGSQARTLTPTPSRGKCSELPLWVLGAKGKNRCVCVYIQLIIKCVCVYIYIYICICICAYGLISEYIHING